MNNTLINNGVLVIGDADLAKTNATVVVGTARGGTSMVAGAMVKLGINMGDQATSPVLEDIKLSESFKKIILLMHCLLCRSTRKQTSNGNGSALLASIDFPRWSKFLARLGIFSFVNIF
jgi:hypothetical protein